MEEGQCSQVGKVTPLKQEARPEFIDLWGRPVDKSKTGQWPAALRLYFLHGIHNGTVFFFLLTLVRYFTVVMHLSVSNAATASNNWSGTFYLLALLGGFLADSYLGCFWTMCIAAVFEVAGLGLLTFSSAYSGLQPPKCIDITNCKPAGTKYLAPLYAALYLWALGEGLMDPNKLAIGGNQFDDSPKEKNQSKHFFVWYYFMTTLGALVGLGPGVYLHTYGSIPWAYGAFLIAFVVAFLVFASGSKKLRHKAPTGSFLTRVAQVLVAAARKHNAPLPADSTELYDALLRPDLVVKLPHSNSLRFLDKAAVIEEDGSEPSSHQRSPWRLCSITQVEETKRIIEMIPIWVFIIPLHLVFANLEAYTVGQAETLDRSLGPNFTVPSNSVGISGWIYTAIALPIYDMLLVPLISKRTKHPFGSSPLQRIGLSYVFAILTVIVSVLVERKRLTYVRDGHFQELPLGAYSLPMSMWWLLPQFCLAAMMDFLVLESSFEFFYLQASTNTRSIGSAFPYSALSLGKFSSVILIKIINRATRNDEGSSWTKEKLGNGGLEYIYWVMCIMLGVSFIFFGVSAKCYRYKYDWKHQDPHGLHVVPNKEADRHQS